MNWSLLYSKYIELLMYIVTVISQLTMVNVAFAASQVAY